LERFLAGLSGREMEALHNLIGVEVASLRSLAELGEVLGWKDERTEEIEKKARALIGK
jgi:DNA-directed RNA polymerase sigma subunit (sigma70/sigma32)